MVPIKRFGGYVKRDMSGELLLRIAIEDIVVYYVIDCLERIRKVNPTAHYLFKLSYTKFYEFSIRQFTAPKDIRLWRKTFVYILWI